MSSIDRATKGEGGISIGAQVIGETILTAFFEPVIKRVTLAVRRNVFPSLGITVAVTLLAIFLLLNPWFGSQRAKYFVIGYMVGGADDIAYILGKSAGDSNISPALVAGAAKAGFYTASDRKIVDQWSETFFEENYINQKTLGKEYDAILAARDLAEAHKPPFQPIGMEGTASSPSCDRTRPGLGLVFVRADSYLATQMQPGDAMKISRKDGLGRPVIAVVNLVPDMPKNVDIYLNRVQMIDFLAATDPVVAIRAVITNARPNQRKQDQYPSDVAISCKYG